MKMKRPKWLTLLTVTKVIFLFLVISGLVLGFFDIALSKLFLNQALGTFAVFAYLEVMKLKEWHEKTLNDTRQAAEITGRILYKLKMRGCKITINGEEVKD